MHGKLRTAAAVALAVSIITAGSAAADDKEDIEAVVAKFEQALNAGDVAAVTALYADDAALLPPGSPIVQGKANIQSFWTSMGEMGVSNLDLTPTEIVVSGNTATEVGTVSYAMGGATETGKYIVLWVKGSDGTWRLHRDIWNEDKAPQAH